ncbi:MAG TPA: DUF4352 domain-containing protein [Candidatus Saccharimonadales bacterium]|jgi:hypothetical protein
MDSTKKRNFFARHKILTGFLVLVGLGVIISAAGSGGSNTQTASNSGSSNAAQTDDKAKVAKLNETARDGKFEFTVTSIECGKASVGTNEYLTKQAQGQFCLANVSVKNVGTEAQTFDSSSQYLYDAAGSKFSADGTASLYANPEGSTFLNQINPGNSVTGAIAFDLPKDKTPVTAELHDSAFSGGVKVSLQ